MRHVQTSPGVLGSNSSHCACTKYLRHACVEEEVDEEVIEAQRRQEADSCEDLPWGIVERATTSDDVAEAADKSSYASLIRGVHQLYSI